MVASESKKIGIGLVGLGTIGQGVAEGNQEGLGTGLALEISRRWPDVQAAFKRHARSGRFRGGEIWSIVPTDARPGFVYLATQPNMRYATLPYLRRAVRRLAQWADRERIGSVALPKIGCGLGKLSWDGEVRLIFEEHLTAGACELLGWTYRNHHYARSCTD